MIFERFSICNDDSTKGAESEADSKGLIEPLSIANPFFIFLKNNS